MDAPDVWLRLTPDEALRLPWINIDPARVTAEPVTEDIDG